MWETATCSSYNLLNKKLHTYEIMMQKKQSYNEEPEQKNSGENVTNKIKGFFSEYI